MGMFSKWFGRDQVPEREAPPVGADPEARTVAQPDPAVPAQPTVEVEALVVEPEPVEPEPVADVPEPVAAEPASAAVVEADVEADVEPEIRATPRPAGAGEPLGATELEERLTGLLDALGSAHRKPFVRNS